MFFPFIYLLWVCSCFHDEETSQFSFFQNSRCQPMLFVHVFFCSSTLRKHRINQSNKSIFGEDVFSKNIFFFLFLYNVTKSVESSPTPLNRNKSFSQRYDVGRQCQCKFLVNVIAALQVRHTLMTACTVPLCIISVTCTSNSSNYSIFISIVKLYKSLDAFSPSLFYWTFFNLFFTNKTLKFSKYRLYKQSLTLFDADSLCQSR